MGRRKYVLIVDDCQQDRMAVADVLRSDYDILEACNGKQALEILSRKRAQISLIMLDLMMPVMDGYEFLEMYRKRKEYSYLPVVVCTTEDDPEREQKSLELGAWDFVLKKSSPGIMRLRAGNAIEKSKVRFLEYDFLTGIYGQQKFYQATRELLDQRAGANFAFIHFDIDRFRIINTLYGSKEGDRLIHFVAGAIRKVMTAYGRGTYGRLGGDVFGMCVPYEDGAAIYHILEGIRAEIRKHSVHYYLETCAGIYLVDDPDMEVAAMHDNAEIAAAQCKGQYMVHDVLYTEEIGQKVLREQHIIDEMDAALAEQQFIVYFQPKYQLKKMAPYGAEALVRWKKPSGEIVLPNEFIPIFERNGFITKLDYYVWEKVCQFIDSELSQGRNPAPISVNVSRVNLYNPDFMDSLIDLIHRYHIPPHYLNLELTESVFSEDAELIQRAVNYLHDAGFTILMDDFGSGYSSLNILKDVDLDVLKIDMKFFSKGNTAEKGAKIIEAVIRMAESLDMMVIAEGVEEKHQVDFLNDLGCDYIQGYYFGRPMSQDQYEKLTNHDEEEQHDMPQPESS
ncbi:EAL domain-containing response regulator [Roseburia hominis]|uniref:two-component system response regulator n=1 Tax=Roseburia hominis TaxID=301301 RepID=UPI001C01003E|nr:EAL domain-containing response regulator [Roseburia hominis]MBT9641721.1 EAL domain-containing protein [Roseburia hominis]